MYDYPFCGFFHFLCCIDAVYYTYVFHAPFIELSLALIIWQ